MTLAQVCAALGQSVPSSGQPDLPLTGADMDSRTVGRGDIFFCIKGERVDGHDFAARAVEAGAGLVVAERPLPGVTHAPVVVVEDSVMALGRVAHAWRERFTGTLVAVTGSAGKTTVKEMLAQVLSQHAPTAKNALNRNNQIGMPLSLLKATGEERFWVMEAGISHAHDMDELGAILCPDVALVLNAGGAHAAGLGERGVAWHKARLLHHLRPDGLGFACADYTDLRREALAAYPQVRLFSTQDTTCPLYATACGSDAAGKGLYALRLPATGEGARELLVTTPFRGGYGAENALAVAAVAAALGLSDAEITAGFATATLPEQRFEQVRCGDWLVINDSYNANPLSMRRMLEAARELAKDRPLVAVLGAMGELGDTAEREHGALGERLAAAGVCAVYWRGDFAAVVEQGLRAAGGKAPFVTCKDAADFATAWRALNVPGGVVLCKGSRSNALEEFVAVMCEERKAGAARKEPAHVL